MFLNWQSRALSSKGFHREGDWCCHESAGEGRVTWTPLVSVAERIDGKPRRRIVHRFGASIRPCCIADDEAPQARLAFWRQVRASWARATGDVLLERDMLTAKIAERVPLPTAEEEAIWEVYRQMMFPPQRPTLTLREFDAALWRLARQAYADQKRREQEEQQARERERRARRARGPFGAGPMPPSVRAECAALGLRWPCSETEVKKAWKRLAAEAHPDRGGNHDAFISLTKARDTLLAHIAAT
jgi:hypothetical protein